MTHSPVLEVVHGATPDEGLGEVDSIAIAVITRVSRLGFLEHVLQCQRSG